MQQVLFWLIVALALNVGGFMAVDGTRALITGEYITPKSGPHAGQLGPWSKVVQAVGIEPRSTAMKLIFALLGLVWLATIACFIFKVHGAWTAMIAVAVASLWYLPFGTLCSAIIVVLLFTGPIRGMFS